MANRSILNDEDLLRFASRAGQAAHGFCFAFLVGTWAYEMESVHATSDEYGYLVTILVTAGASGYASGGRDAICQRNGGGWLTRFPPAVFLEGGHQVVHALLADQMSIWTFVFMQDAVRALFTDLVDDVYADIKELVHYVPSSCRRIVHHVSSTGVGNYIREDVVYPDKDGKGDLKGVYLIRLRSGLKVVLDLTGQQYGVLQGPITPWSKYAPHSITKIKYTVPLGSHLKKHVERMTAFDSISHLTVTMELLCCFNEVLADSERLVGFALPDIPFRPEVNYNVEKQHLCNLVAQYLHDRVISIDTNAPYSSFFGTFDIRHPALLACREVEKLKPDRSVATAVRYEMPIETFDWGVFDDVLRMPDSAVEYNEKCMGKAIGLQRCVYKMPGDSRLLFLQEDLPNTDVPFECMSENPLWRKKR